METVVDAISPDDIDLDFVPQRATNLEVRAIGDEHVVIGGVTQISVLNSTAALVLQFADGEATVRELVEDFTDVLGVDRAVVEHDVVAFVRELGANGLLQGVALGAPEPPEGFDLDWTPPAPIAVG